ncbi:MAG: DNA alkylation repair protein [Acidobacteria bacterium]|nr:DNA alkylation repair protein [Acidobacteriota bacterium]
MAEALKTFYGPRVIAELGRDLAAAYPRLARPRFEADCLAGLDQLELIARAWHIAETMRAHLPQSFEKAAKVLLRSLGPEYGGDPELSGMEAFRYMPHVCYVGKYGLDHFEPAMQLQYELTKRFTAEFSIRAYLVRHPQRTYERLRKWAHDPNHHVRRLVSEGTRPRLPWAPRLRAFQEDPKPVIALLQLLKDDPELYVRRSVANNLNDIAKDHPDLAVQVCREWSRGAGPERKWIVRHALRSLTKQGHPRALELQGFGGKPKVEIAKIRFQPQRPKIGESLKFHCELASTARKQQTLLIDFAVHFVKANGAASPKVFKLKQLTLQPGERTLLKGSVSFKILTTRKPYPGSHKIELLVNGVAFPLGRIQVA